MLSTFDLYQLEQQRNQLFNTYNNNTINIAGRQQDVALNRGIALDDNQRDFLRAFRDFGAGFSARGLETSGVRNRFTDRALADQQRTRDRLGQGFDRQANQLDLAQFEETRNFNQSVATSDAYRSATRASLASQIRGLS